MKKTNLNRMVAYALALLMLLSMFVGCTNQQGREDLKNAIQNDQNKGEITDNAGNSNENDFSAQITEIQEQVNKLSSDLNVVKAENATLKAENESFKAENDTLKIKMSDLEIENSNLKNENSDLKQIVEELKNKSTHQIVVRDNVIWVHIEDFLYAKNSVGALISAQDGTGYALRTLKGVHVKVYDDEHGDEHLVSNFDLPMYDYYTIVLTADEGKTSFMAGFGNYSFENRGLFTSFTSCEFAKELTSMPKNGGSGKKFYELIKVSAVVVEENGTYRFAIDAGAYDANPIVKPACNHGSGCHCGNCDKCPVLEAETIIKTETVEKIVEKIVEVPGETIYIPGETVYIPGETVYIPGETVYIPGETIYIPGETIYVDREVQVNYCGRCDNLLENCTCSNPEHNERPEVNTPAHNERPSNSNNAGTTTNTPAHNEKDEGTSSEHNSRPGTDASQIGHNDRSTSSSNANSGDGSSTTAPAHSPRP